MSAYRKYLAALERVPSIEPRVLAITLGRHRGEFRRRGWVTEDSYLTHVMVPFLDSEEEVEVAIDEEARVFRYRSPQRRSRIVERPLAEITRYVLQVDAWLNDLAVLIGIEPRQRPERRVLVPDHLWHLGNVRITSTHEFSPVFVGRMWERAPNPQVTTALRDPIWPRGGIVLRHQPSAAELPGDHAMRGLGDFLRVTDDGQDIFDAPAFDRVLRGFVTANGASEPEQFLRGNRLKLPHFPRSRELSPERAKIVKVMWGVDGKAPPEMSWADVNGQANTGYQSFDDAFGGVAAREDVIEKSRRARYRLRRNP